MDDAASQIREVNSEITRLRGELENNQKPSLERLKQQKTESESRFREKTKLLAETEPKLQLLEESLLQLREREAGTLDRAAKYQPMLDSLDAQSEKPESRGRRLAKIAQQRGQGALFS